MNELGSEDHTMDLLLHSLDLVDLFGRPAHILHHIRSRVTGSFNSKNLCNHVISSRVSTVSSFRPLSMNQRKKKNISTIFYDL